MDAEFFVGEPGQEQEEQAGPRLGDQLDRLLAAGSTLDWITPMIGWAGEALVGWAFFNIPAEYMAEVRWALRSYGLAPCNEMLLGWECGRDPARLLFKTKEA